MRLQLKPGLQVLSRGPATVQIGLDGRHGTVLHGLTTEDVALLHALIDGIDGGSSLAPPGPTGSATAAVGPTGPTGRSYRLLTTLAGAGLLLGSRSGRAALARVGELRSRLAPDAAAWSLVHPGSGDGWGLIASRRERTVEIRGSGRTGAALATLLAATGVGTVAVTDPTTTAATDLLPGGAHPVDVGLPRTQAAGRAIERAAGRAPGASDGFGGSDGPDGSGGSRGSRGSAGPGVVPDLVVLLDRAAADATRADGLLAADVPHLSIVIRETSVVVGPLVIPGLGPCLRCLDLHRSERDRQWPLILAQLVSRRHRRSAPREESALAQLAAALAALQILGHLDGQAPPAALGATLEVELPDGLASRRPWPAHASCGCHWPPDPPPVRSGLGQGAQDGPAPATMLS